MKTLSGQPWAQNLEEFNALLDFVKDNFIKSYLEVGARHGDCFYEMVKAMPKKSIALAVDLPESLWGRKGSKEALQRCVSKLRDDKYQANVIFGNSQKIDTHAKVCSFRGAFDMVMIDADHTYQGVKRDFELYGPLGNFVVFHDIVGFDCKDKRHDALVEVPKLWQEIKQSGDYQYWEFVGQGSKMGIGICTKK